MPELGREAARLAALAGCVLVFASGHALATPRETPAEARISMRAAVTCVARQEPRQSAALLETLPGSPDEHRAAHRLSGVFVSCSGGEQQMDSDDFSGLRDGLAVALVRSMPDRPIGMGESWYLARTKDHGTPPYGQRAMLGRQEFGSCVGRADPAAAHDLVRSASDSTEERAAIARLRPVVAPCVAQGVKARLDPDSLRDLLAEPVYHALVGQ